MFSFLRNWLRPKRGEIESAFMEPRPFSTQRSRQKKLAILWGFSDWKKELMVRFLPEYRILYPRKKKDWPNQRKALERCGDCVFIAWGMTENERMAEYAERNRIPLHRMEDGFIRSMELGCKHTPPLSLVLDDQGIYFDATRASALENALNTHDFASTPGLLDEAAGTMMAMRRHRVSKYNFKRRADPSPIFGPKKRLRILVVGQLERDASLRFGWAGHLSNMELLELARAEHPEAEIVYRPHPESMHFSLDRVVGNKSPADICHTRTTQLIDLFPEVDRIYTMTSLCGMEALIHGIPVTVAGMPFYAGWGLTDDKQTCERRTRKLSLAELFAIAYLRYPRYAMDLDNPAAGCNATIRHLAREMATP